MSYIKRSEYDCSATGSLVDERINGEKIVMMDE
jgi:hypothetical protein